MLPGTLLIIAYTAIAIALLWFAVGILTLIFKHEHDKRLFAADHGASREYLHFSANRRMVEIILGSSSLTKLFLLVLLILMYYLADHVADMFILLSYLFTHILR